MMIAWATAFESEWMFQRMYPELVPIRQRQMEQQAHNMISALNPGVDFRERGHEWSVEHDSRIVRAWAIP